MSVDGIAHVFRLRFTAAFLMTMVIANWLAGTFAGMLPPHALIAWGISHQTILNGEVYRLFTGTFLSHDAGMFLRQFCFATIVIGAYEWLEGTWRTLAVFFLIDILGILVILFGVLPVLVGAAAGFSQLVLLTYDVGMSGGGFGLIGALIARHRQRWLLITLTLAVIVVKVWNSLDVIADTVHVVCLFLGFAFQAAPRCNPKSRQLLEVPISGL